MTTTAVSNRLVDKVKAHDPIVKYGDPVLRQISTPVDAVTDEIPELVERMAEIMHGARGVGLAAPQLGISKRIIIYDVGDGLVAMINPKIVRQSGEQMEPAEGCLSIPGLRGTVKRAELVTVQALDQFGNSMRLKAEGYASRVIQHEVDHLDGILFIDKADPDTLKWMTAEELEDEDADDDELGEE